MLGRVVGWVKDAGREASPGYSASSCVLLQSLLFQNPCCMHSSGIYPPLLSSKPAIPFRIQLQVHGRVPPDRSICNARSCMVQMQEHSLHRGWKLNPDNPNPTNEAGPACSFIPPGNWEGENCPVASAGSFPLSSTDDDSSCYSPSPCTQLLGRITGEIPAWKEHRSVALLSSYEFMYFHG